LGRTPANLAGGGPEERGRGRSSRTRARAPSARSMRWSRSAIQPTLAPRSGSRRWPGRPPRCCWTWPGTPTSWCSVTEATALFLARCSGQLACSASCTPPARSRSSVPPRRDRRPLPPTRRPRRSVPNQAPWCWRVLKRRDATQSNGRATCASRSQVLHSPALTVLIGTSREIADGSAELGAPWPVVHIVRLALGATVVQVGGERMEPWTPHGCLTFDKWNAGVQGVDASVYPSERGSARKCLRPRLAFGAEVRPWPPCASVGCRVAYRGLAAGVPRRQRARCDLRSTKRRAVGVRGPHC
jgi:hypothetical protein